MPYEAYSRGPIEPGSLQDGPAILREDRESRPARSDQRSAGMPEIAR